MKKNMATIDRIIRVTLAIIAAILYFNGQISGITAIVLGVFALTPAPSVCARSMCHSGYRRKKRKINDAPAAVQLFSETGMREPLFRMSPKAS